MLCGFPPFFGENELEIRKEVLNCNFDFSGIYLDMTMFR
jgi:hypothetical protein